MRRSTTDRVGPIGDGIGWDTMVPAAFERRNDAAVRDAVDTSITSR